MKLQVSNVVSVLTQQKKCTDHRARLERKAKNGTLNDNVHYKLGLTIFRNVQEILCKNILIK